VLNEKGYERARAAGLRAINYAFGVTDSFTKRNQGATVAEAVSVSHRLVDRARQDDVQITVTLSVAFGCPFEGRVLPAQVLRVVEQVMSTPPDLIVVADTIGVGVPAQVRELIPAVRAFGVAAGAHFHNTRNTGLTNAVTALECGAELLDASVGGAGGCPFAPRATGNIATEDLVYLLHGMGYQTGIDLVKLVDVSHWLSEQLGKQLPAGVSRAELFQPV
jgi:hydroxymethylglutaryl-CoA lyase/(R)-citramalyl-CoA lyase